MVRCLLICLCTAFWAFAGPRDASWKAVREAMDKGLPRTAIAALEPILKDALARKDSGEAVKALGLRIALEANIQGNRPEEKILRLQAEIPKAPAAMRPMMEGILANWYWQYYQRNRWRFLQRGQTAGSPGKDFTTWDLPRILAEIDRHFTLALADARGLQETPISAFDGLLEKGTVPDAYRPTLYDFLAQNALAFYGAGEQGIPKAEDAFEWTAEGPIFDPLESFLAWKLPAGSTEPLVKALRLYQDLLAFHRKDPERSAFADLELARLAFGATHAGGDGKNARHKAALARFVEAWSGHESSARALSAWATVLRGEGNLLEARRLAERGLRAFPGTPGGIQCFNLISEINARSASLKTERVWNDPAPTLDVTYRNVDRVYFRAVPADFETHLKSMRWRWNGNPDDFLRKRLDDPPALAWSADLPPAANLKERTERLPAPQGLKPGFYYLFASHDPAFRPSGGPLSVVPIWVSRLALVVRRRESQGGLDGFVLDAKTGEPLQDAEVTAWVRDREGRFQRSRTVRTDADGLFEVPQAKGGPVSVLLQAQWRGEGVSSSHEAYASEPESASGPLAWTLLFTDRSIYRPGQTLAYKGICASAEVERSDYRVLAKRPVTVVLRDPNGREIARHDHVCNELGAFSGTFTTPSGGLTGRMSLSVEDPSGSAEVQVEEYKRPRFQVELSAPEEAPRLNAPVVLVGKATGYTGAAVGGAKVAWRVQREAQLPPWCWWGFRQPSGDGQALAHGTAVTQPDGTFRIAFTARPDSGIPAKDEPVFRFTIHADVTDTAGETRSRQRSFRIAEAALQADLSGQEWQTPQHPVEMLLRTSTLDGEARPAEGQITLQALVPPAQVQRAPLETGTPWEPAAPDPSDPRTWEPGKVVHAAAFRTAASGDQKIAVPLGVGVYRALMETKDPSGKPVTARWVFQVVDPGAAKHEIKQPSFLGAPAWRLEPGQRLQALWGTGYEQGRAFVELLCGNKPLERYWTAPGLTQARILQEVGENLRGGFILRVTQVRENRAYLYERLVEVPWSSKELHVKWEHFTSKLGPSQRETWTALIEAPGGKKGEAEMAAALYDASLDALTPHAWPTGFEAFFRTQTRPDPGQFQNLLAPFQYLQGGWTNPTQGFDWRYRSFPAEIQADDSGYRGRMLSAGVVSAPLAKAAPGVSSVVEVVAEQAAVDLSLATATGAGSMPKMDRSMAYAGVEAAKAAPPPPLPPAPALDQVQARRNLRETAFFFPHLLADAEGRVRMEFTLPEALTEWKFLGFAHDRELRGGALTGRAVTAKDWMVEPNPPRFLREGDQVVFAVKVTNQTGETQTGRVRLGFTDARTGESRDAHLGNLKEAEQAVEVPARDSRTLFWPIHVPEGCEPLAYKVVGAAGGLSDGEEGLLPVLSRRILVTESLPMPLRGPQEKTFEFKGLLASGSSSTLRQESLTLQMVSHPVWHAVLALPYLMEYPYECSEQTFNRLYANLLARHIANRDPEIRRVFDQWKATPALDSPLEKNPELKAVLLEETPWLRQARSEGEARRNVGLLFDGNRLEDETARALQKLTALQLGDGRWPWFPGGQPSDFITLYVVTGFGRLRHLGVDLDVAPAKRALESLDAWMDHRYRRIRRKETYVPDALDALYLYGRSFFLKDAGIQPRFRQALDFFLKQSRLKWLDLPSRQSQGHLALALARFAAQEGAADPIPRAILASLKERSVDSAEMGRFWRDTEAAWWWHRAPIETQALMIEAFDEVGGDAQAVEDCQTWLLKQKQTQDWRTTKATADAIYALLLRGADRLSRKALVEVSLGGHPVQPSQVEAGTGFFEKRFVKEEVKPALGLATLRKRDGGVSWGSLHWQYLEDIAKVKPFEGTPLALRKSLWVRENTASGPALRPVSGPLSVGDEVVVRVELRADRDMEFVHLKDLRGSGTEPVNVLSGYRFQDGLAYYESTRDTASHFFIDHLPKGTYVFEYPVRVQLKGRYQMGNASVQCMYAPEFNSHSGSVELDVK